MTIPQAIRSAFERWSTFGGRAGGTEYWWFVLFGTIVFGLAGLLDLTVSDATLSSGRPARWCS